MTTQTYLQATNQKGYAPVYVRYFHDGIFYPVPLKHSILPNDFDKKTRMVKSIHPDHQLINYKAMLVHNRLMETARELELKGMEPTRDLVKIGYLRSLELQPLPDPTAQQVQQYKPTVNTNVATPIKVKVKTKGHDRIKPELLENLSRFDDDFVLHLVRFKELATEWITTNTNITTVTRTQRYSWLNTLLEFATKTSTSLAFGNFNLSFYEKYARYLMFDSEHDLYNNAFGSHVKRLKVFLNWCENMKGLQVCKQYKTYRILQEEKQIDDAYLDRHELDLIWNHKTYKSDAKERTYERLIDLCVFQNLTGLRFSDVTFKGGLKVIGTGKNKMLVGKTKKSRYKQSYQIPLALDSRIEVILQKYEYNLSDLMSDVEYNRRIKELLKEVYRKHKLHQTPYIIYRYKLDKQYEFKFLKADMISSHSNRRGWVTWVYKELRLPETMILKMMGSRSNTELKKYISLDSDSILSMVHSLELV